MDGAKMRAMIKEAEELKQGILTDFPELEQEFLQSTETAYAVSGDYSLKEIIYRSLMVGATIMYKKNRDAQRAAEEAIASARNKT